MRLLPILTCLVLAASVEAQERQIRLPRQPCLSPDAAHIAFSWRNDVWTAPAEGGSAVRVTLHPATDQQPCFSPDGERIAFVSDRTGASQIHIVPAAGGDPLQVTHDSNRKRLLGFTSDGKGLLVAQGTDRGWTRSESYRLFVLDLDGRAPKRMLFDAGFSDATLSPDGEKVLFTRGRAAWNRKGYSGSQALQLWLADLTQTPPTLTRLDEDQQRFQNVSHMFPLWAPDGKGYYYVSDPDGTFDVYYRALDGGEARRITRVSAIDNSDDGVTFPSLSADGKTMLFRRRFDLQRLDLESGALSAITLEASGDSLASFLERTTESGAREVAFTDDGKQIAFVSGEDVWVMDRILREPVRVTSTPHAESSVVFSSDGKRLFFVSDAGGEVDIWEATHGQEENIWWLAEEFTLRQVTDDRDVEGGLKPSPGSKHIAYIKGTDVFVMDEDGSDHRRVVQSWSPPSFDWSPDGKWMVYATQDSDYNPDVWVVPLDGTREPFNLSRHPDVDGDPAWSGDGKRIAFVSRRDGEESDIYYVNLTREEEEQTERDRKLEEALEAMKKGSGRQRGGAGGPAGAGDEPAAGGRRGGRRPGGFARPGGPGGPGGGGRPVPAAAPQEPAGDDPAPAPEDEPEQKPEEEEEEEVEVTIEFEGILDRLHRISISDSRESGLLWSPDGKKLAFSATVDGERGFYTVEFPEAGAPKRLAASGLSSARWLKETKEIVGTSRSSAGGTGGGRPRGPSPFGRGGFGGGGATPAAMDARGQVESFSFSVRRVRDWASVRQISFDQGWRAMRDRFYDENLNNRDWEAVRAKYRPVAAQCLGAEEFSELMNMMLGELNASHMGHSGGSEPLPVAEARNDWTPTTYHLGLRFDLRDQGPGLRVESVIPGSPCDRERSRVEAGEVLLAIEGQPVGPEVDLDRILTMDEDREVELTVADREGTERKVGVWPTRSVQGLLYDEFVENTRRTVEELSEGTLGYLHIRGMDQRSLIQMEEDFYHAGAGKEGLIIDVRFNGGGSTADHVLTMLTQPQHAITRSRGSGEGYPQDRKVYASWSKPIVLMCNEHSFSNAEILSHAVKQLGRGRVVGMRTAGGVISTGGAGLLDGSYVRMPTRGWFLVTTGEDMELNGCEPDIALWNPPDGGDLQLEAAVEALLEDVEAEKAGGNVRIIPASYRRKQR